MKTTLYTSYDCVIELENEKVPLSKNEHLSFESDLLPIKVIDKKQKVSFIVDLSPSQFYRTIEKFDKVLIFLIDGFLQENIDIYSYENKGEKSFLKFSPNRIVFSSANNEKSISFPSFISLISQGNFNHIDYVCFEYDGKELLICYNTQTGKTRLFRGGHFDFASDGFTMTDEDTPFYKKIVQEFVVDDDGLKSKSKTFSKKDMISKNLLIYNFFSSLKVQDYQTSLSFLSSHLQEKLSAQSLKDFFGDISYFFVLDSFSCFVISNGQNIIYDICVENNSITEINDNRS